MDGLLWEQSDEDNLFIPFHFLVSFAPLFFVLFWSGEKRASKRFCLCLLSFLFYLYYPTPRINEGVFSMKGEKMELREFVLFLFDSPLGGVSRSLQDQDIRAFCEQRRSDFGLSQSSCLFLISEYIQPREIFCSRFCFISRKQGD